ncbi:MAG: amidohydrolase [Caldilineaceae bacterium]|nr:amidohydrolase [Caldilineaceae bacterium]
MKQTVDLLIRHALIITQDDARRVIEDGALAVRGNQIAALGATAEVDGAFTAARTIDATGKALFPGLLNIHTHLFQSAVKGLGEDMAVEQWVQAVTFPTAAAMNAEEAYLLAMVSCLENLRSGATTVMDFNYALRDPALHTAVIQAMVDSGLRGRYTRTIVDNGAPMGFPPALCQPAEEALAHAQALQRDYAGAGDGRLDIGLAIGVIWGVTEQGLRATRRVADATGMTITMHVNESPYDNVAAQQLWGRSTIPMLAETGVLGPDFIAVHCVHMTDEDIDLFKKHAVAVAYNAVSNMYLGSGIAPIVRMADLGLTIGLATDGSGSNNCQDMLETLKFSALLQKVGRMDAACVLAQQALDWATRGGAHALGLAEQIGSLAVGRKADFFLVDPFTPKAIPVHDPVATLVYSAGQSNVETVVVDGRVLMEGGRFTQLDEAQLLRDAQRAAQTLAARAGTERLLERRGKWRPV